MFIYSGENVEDAFLDTAKKIYQNIQDGRCVKLLFCLLHSLKSAAHNMYTVYAHIFRYALEVYTCIGTNKAVALIVMYIQDFNKIHINVM